MQPNKVWTLAAIGLLAVAAACSGGGSRSTPQVPTNQGPQQSSKAKNLQLRFTIQGPSSQSAARSLKYVNGNIFGGVVTITGASPSPGPTGTTLLDQEQFDLSGPPNCNSSGLPRTCTFYASAKAGVDNIELDTYDNTPNNPGQIATPSVNPTPCKTKELSFQTGGPSTWHANNCIQVASAHALSVGIANGVTITAGVNNVTLILQPIADSFQINNHAVYDIFTNGLCDPEVPNVSSGFTNGGPANVPEPFTCSEDKFGSVLNDVTGSGGAGGSGNGFGGPSGGGLSGSLTGRPNLVISINGNQANAFGVVQVGPGNPAPGINNNFIQPEDGSRSPELGQNGSPGITCGNGADNWYNPFDVYFYEGGSLQTGFSTTGQLYKKPCGGSYASVATNPGFQTDTQFSTDDQYEELYTGHGAVGTFNANGTVSCGGESNGCGPYFGVINLRPHSIDTVSGLGPLPVICTGCEAPSPGNDPPGGLGVGYGWGAADWRQVSSDISPLYGVVVADSRCGNPTTFAAVPCGGSLPANDDTGNGHNATMVLGGPQELGIIVAAQFWPPTGTAGQSYTITLSAGCPTDASTGITGGGIRVFTPNNGFNYLSQYPGFTDNMGKLTWGGQIFVIQAGRVLFTTAANCFAIIGDGSGIFTNSFVNPTNGQILISSPTATSAFPGTITI